ncbi:MAG TPA: hypothetical protein VFS21_14730 [Roseiflexaceae bacterium]|nr:hypothetical protein [Roseiflexaceae bacterium]
MQRKTTAFWSALVLVALLGGWFSAPTGTARAATGREPVIIIPGVAGSEFTTSSAFTLSVPNGRGGTYTHSYGAGEKVWVNTWEAALSGDDDYFDALKFQADAVTPVAPQLYPSGLYGSAYGDLVDYLKRQGYVEGVDLWLFPYDWRKDIRTITGLLDSRVTQALIGANGGRTDPNTWTIRRADIVAHSMGGLVARSYISDPARAGRVDQLITLGSPQLGAAKFLKTLIYGDVFGPNILGIGLNPEEIRDVVQNMAGPWQLLPSRPYYDYYNNSDSAHLRPYIEDRDVDGNGATGGVLGYDSVKTLLRNLGKNQNTQTRAEQFHDVLDRQRNGGVSGVRWAALTGYGDDTLGQLRDYTGSCLTWTGYRPCNKLDETPVDGDGTVAIMSSAMGDPWSGQLIDSGATRWYIEREHVALVQYDYILGVKSGDGPVLPWIGDLLRGAIAMNSASAASTDAQTEAKGRAVVQAAPAKKLSGTLVSASGKAALEVRSSGGGAQLTGRARGQELQSARSSEASYNRLPGAEFAFLKRDQPYEVRAAAEQDGALDLKVRLFGNGRIERTVVYPQVLVRQGGSVRVSFAPGLARSAASVRALPAMQIDADGDGRYESSLPAMAVLDERQSADTQRPELLLGAPVVAGTQATVGWAASDALSGLAIQQALINPDSAAPRPVANGETVALAPGRYTLEVLVQDNAGNATVRTVDFNVGTDTTQPVTPRPSADGGITRDVCPTGGCGGLQ